MDACKFLFIASDYKPQPGGRADYIDNLAKGLIGIGSSTKVLAVVQPQQKKRLAFLEKYEEWVIPFQVVHDERPTNWLGNKFVSLLEIVRCLSPKARRVLEKTSYFQASADSLARLEGILANEKPTMIVFGHLDMRLYPFALFLLERKVPYGIIAHEGEIYPFRNRINEFIRRGAISIVLLLFAGSFRQLFSLAIFAEWLFYMVAASTVFVLRRKEPDTPRPYRAWGYPFVPAIFLGAAAALLYYTFTENLRNSAWGVAVIAAGVPIYAYFAKNRAPAPGD